MVTSEQIKDELKEIRYYMSRKAVFDKSAESVGKSCIEKRMALYNRYICDASPRLYDIYVSLYLDNNSQESLAEKTGYSIVHIWRLNSRLIKFFQQKMNSDLSGEAAL